MLIRKLFLGTSLALLATAAHAEFFGTLNGRLADPTNMPTISVEGAFITGDDYQNINGRLNYQLNELVTVYGDFGLTEFGSGFGPDADGNAFGAGVYYYMADQTFLQNMDFAVHGSYHTSSLEFDGNNGFGGNNSFDLDLSGLVIEALISGREPISDNGLMWYANIGLHRLSSEISGFGGDNTDNEFGFGGGVILPMGGGELYAGADLIDELQFGVGYRYFLQ